MSTFVHPEPIKVIGLGSPILTDDGVGLKVIEDLALEFPKITFEPQTIGGLDLLEAMLDYHTLIIVDVIQTKSGSVGEIYRIAPEAFKGFAHFNNPHQMNFASILESGKRLFEERMPKDLEVVAIEVKDVTTFSESFTPEIQKVYPEFIETVRSLLKEKINMLKENYPFLVE